MRNLVYSAIRAHCGEKAGGLQISRKYMVDDMAQKERKEQSHGKTYFGDKIVDFGQKSALVREVFENAAQKYDIMNDVLSLGIHRLWKEAMINWLAPRAGWRVLDVAGGTGDIAFRLLERAHTAEVTILDMSEKMLEKGRARAQKRGYGDRIDWVAGDAMALPFDDKSFDCYTISFGIRNVADIEKALSEALRVLKIGGRLMVLEFSHVSVPLLKGAYDFYSRKLIPELGQIIANDRASYQYLVESIRRFPNQERFRAMIIEAGFSHVEYRDLSGGIVALHSGWKI